MYQPVAVPPRRTVALTGARLLPIADAEGNPAAEITSGTIVLDEGTITAIGPDAEVEVPAGAEVIDASGTVIAPGFVESHAHMGVHEDGEGGESNDVNEMTDPNGSALRALDAINPADVGFKDALRGGVTTAVVKPGSGNPIGGRTAALKTWGRVVDEMLISQDISVKSAMGENPKRIYGERKQTPATRLGVAKVQREAFVKARNYIANRAAAAEVGVPFDRDLGLETLADVLTGELVWDQHCHRADDIATAIRLAEEFGYRLIINHGTEGHLIADYIAEKGLDVIVGPLMTSRSKVELRHRTLATPAAYAKAGVRFALTTDHPVVPIFFFVDQARFAVREGLDPEVALQAMTIHPAAILGLDDRVGSLAVGRDADIVQWSAHPLDFDARVTSVYVSGRHVYTHDFASGEAFVADPFGPTRIHEP